MIRITPMSRRERAQAIPLNEAARRQDAKRAAKREAQGEPFQVERWTLPCDCGGTRTAARVHERVILEACDGCGGIACNLDGHYVTSIVELDSQFTPAELARMGAALRR